MKTFKIYRRGKCINIDGEKVHMEEDAIHLQYVEQKTKDKKLKLYKLYDYTTGEDLNLYCSFRESVM